MKIVIIGDGKVGYKLARQLSAEKYDVILIDNNEEKLRKSIEKMDVFVLREREEVWKYSREQMCRMPILLLRVLLQMSAICLVA